MIRIEHLSVVFGGVRPLDDLDATLGAPIVGLIGPNGAGKTTLLNVLSGFVRPASGRVWIDAVELTHRSPTQRVRLGLRRTFQQEQVVADLTTTFVDDSIRQTAGSNKATISLLEDSMQRARIDYINSEEPDHANIPGPIRAADREFARRHYLETRTRLAEAKLVANLSDRRLTPFLELLDAASLPVEPETRHFAAIGSAVGGGILLGIALQLIVNRRAQHNAPEAA